MRRLNGELKRLLKAIEPYEYDETFFDRLGSGEIDVLGFDPKRVVTEMRELVSAGAIRIYESRGVCEHFYLMSDFRCYTRERAVQLASSALDRLLQLFMGASGGLVVFILSKLVE